MTDTKYGILYMCIYFLLNILYQLESIGCPRELSMLFLRWKLWKISLGKFLTLICHVTLRYFIIILER